MSNIFFVHAKGPHFTKMCCVQTSALAVIRIYTERKCISQQPMSHWYHSRSFMYSQLLRFQLSLPKPPRENWQFNASHLIQLLILVFPSPKLSCFSCIVTWKILQLPSCFLPWTDTVFSMLPPSLLPALRVAIFRPRKLACMDPADYPQPLGNLCTMLSIPEARSRHTWPAWSHYGLGRLYLLGSNVSQVFYFWCSSTSAERLGTTLTGCVASPGLLYLFKMSYMPCFCVCETRFFSWARRTICVTSLFNSRVHNVDTFHIPSAYIPFM